MGSVWKVAVYACVLPHEYWIILTYDSSGDGEEDEVEGETEPMASSQQREQQDGESRGERSHLIVWQVTVQDWGAAHLKWG